MNRQRDNLQRKYHNGIFFISTLCCNKNDCMHSIFYSHNPKLVSRQSYRIPLCTQYEFRVLNIQKENGTVSVLNTDLIANAEKMPGMLINLSDIIKLQNCSDNGLPNQHGYIFEIAWTSNKLLPTDKYWRKSRYRTTSRIKSIIHTPCGHYELSSALSIFIWEQETCAFF